jgi:hypothetical protein
MKMEDKKYLMFSYRVFEDNINGSITIIGSCGQYTQSINLDAKMSYRYDSRLACYNDIREDVVGHYIQKCVTNIDYGGYDDENPLIFFSGYIILDCDTILLGYILEMIDDSKMIINITGVSEVRMGIINKWDCNYETTSLIDINSKQLIRNSKINKILYI